jgi:perosamine synthetase
MIGYNYRLTDIGGAIGREQLRRLPAYNEQRAANAAFLTAHINVKGLVAPSGMPDATHVYHQYVLRVTPDFPMTRDDLIRYLADRGIGSAVHYPIPVHRQPVYVRGRSNVSCPVAERLSGEVLSLPVHPQVTAPMLDHICDTLNGVV